MASKNKKLKTKTIKIQNKTYRLIESKIKIGYGKFDSLGARSRVRTFINEDGTKIKKTNPVALPEKFRQELIKRYSKSKKRRVIEFAYGSTDDRKFHAMSIVRPPDLFCKKTGRKIVKGRLISMIKGKIPFKAPEQYICPSVFFMTDYLEEIEE